MQDKTPRHMWHRTTLTAWTGLILLAGCATPILERIEPRECHLYRQDQY
jgi:hypothetical protein